MSEKSRTGRYLYAVVDGAVKSRGPWGPIGIGDGEVYILSCGTVSAVVSDVPNRKLRPERRHIMAYQRVLKALLEAGTVLPMSFGTIADGSKAVEQFLSRNNETLSEQLARLVGQVEMGLCVRWDVSNIFEYFVKTHPELRIARDRLFGKHREPTLEEKLELGRLFELLLNEDRRAHTRKVEEVLAPHCTQYESNPPRREQEVMNLACLIKREARAEFEAEVFEAAALFDDSFAFDYTGPWAPHNFVRLNLDL